MPAAAIQWALIVMAILWIGLAGCGVVIRVLQSGAARYIACILDLMLSACHDCCRASARSECFQDWCICCSVSLRQLPFAMDFACV